MAAVLADDVENGHRRVAQFGGLAQDHIEHGPVIIPALADDLEDFPRRCLARQPRLQLAELADVLDGDDGLGSEGFDQSDLVGGEGLHHGAKHDETADPADIAATDQALLSLFPDDARMQHWLGWAGDRIAFQGLPARICWLGYGQRDKAGLLFNAMVRDGRVKAPIVIGRDHLDAGSVASPYRETEAMKDGSDAVSDWALLNFATGIASGAGWMSFHHGGGVGMGYSQHAGLVAVADGSDDADRRLALCLTNDPAMGVIRHADAGYEKAIDVARERGVDMPSL